MTKTKLFWRRSLCMIFCVILIFSISPHAAYADTAVITSGTMYSYFQTYNTSGTWVDLQTPAHWITATGEVAYCLQTSKDNPYNGGYYSIDGEEVYDDYVLTGLRAILTHGYPADSGGFDAQAARYATANAIRFWLAENHCDGVLQYLNLTVNGDWIRGKYGCEDLFDWCIGLVNLARTQTVVVSDGSLTFNPSEISLTQNGQYFSGSAYLSKGISGDYSLMDNSPDGSLIISGHTGVQSETLNLSIPVQYANQEFMLCAYGFDETPTARLFFWAPAAANQQRIVTYVLDQNENTFVRGFLTIRTPGSVVQPKKGSLQILKTDPNGNALSGVGFTLYDSSKNALDSQTTGSSGVVTFSDLPLGNYYYAETSALPGYVPDSTLYPVTISSSTQMVQKTLTNSLGKGGIKNIKKNDDGEYLSGVEFTLYDADKQAIKTGTTDENGVLIFDQLPIGDYWYAETSELPGYIPNHNLMAARVGYHTAVDEHTVTNYKAHGHVRVIKSDENGSPLAGVHFKLFNEAGSFIDEGDTDTEGKLVFSMLPIGKYFVQETATLDGFVLDDTPIPIELSNDGDVVTKEITNASALGNVSVTKTDTETGAPLSGVHFILTDSNGTSVGGGTTDETGVVVFSHLPLGTYTLTETETRNGYILDDTPRKVTISTNGQTVEISISNTPARGSVSVVKTDSETGAALAGVHFKLLDEAGALVAEGDTGADGTLTLPNIPVGYYILRETATITGYLLDENPISVEIRENGQVVQINATNTMARGGVTVTKTDSETGAALKGVHFKLFDAANNLAAEGDTDENGKLVLNGLPLGSYTLKETAAIDGYAVDETPIPVEITENGQILEISVENTPFSGSLEIMKKAAHEDIMLMGAGYRLFNSSGEQIKEGYTDASGKLTFNDLPGGTYKYQEGLSQNTAPEERAK